MAQSRCKWAQVDRQHLVIILAVGAGQFCISKICTHPALTKRRAAVQPVNRDHPPPRRPISDHRPSRASPGARENRVLLVDLRICSLNAKESVVGNVSWPPAHVRLSRHGENRDPLRCRNRTCGRRPHCREGGLAHRFAVIQETYLPDKDGTYFDEALWRRRLEFACGTAPGGRVGIVASDRAKEMDADDFLVAGYVSK